MRQLIAVGQNGIDPSVNGNCSVLPIANDNDCENTNEGTVAIDKGCDEDGFHGFDLETEEIAFTGYDLESNISDIDVDFDEDFEFPDSENDDKDYCNMPDFDGEEDDALTSIDTDDLFASNCLTYVGGYLIYTIKDRKVCVFCRAALENNEKDKLEEKYLKLIRQKARGKLYIPSKTVFSLLQAAQKIFITDVYNKQRLPRESNLDELLTKKVMDSTDLLKLFP
jgi:hypothetical protein